MDIVECLERALRGNTYTGYTEVITAIEDVVWVVITSLATVVLVSAALTSRPAAVLRGLTLNGGISGFQRKHRRIVRKGEEDKARTYSQSG